MRIRTVKPDFFLDEQLCARPPLERILFEGLWCLADREGRLEDRPLKIKAMVLPYDDCDVAAMLDSLGERLFILRYEVDGRKYIQVRTFSKHQRPNIRESKSEIPAPPQFARARTRTHVQGNGEREREREWNNTPPTPPASAVGNDGAGASTPAGDPEASAPLDDLTRVLRAIGERFPNIATEQHTQRAVKRRLRVQPADAIIGQVAKWPSRWDELPDWVLSREARQHARKLAGQG